MIATPRTPRAFLLMQEISMKLAYGPALVKVPDQERYVIMICAALPGALCELVGTNQIRVYPPRYRRAQKLH